MAKLESGKTITIKINGEKRTYIEEPTAPNHHPNNRPGVETGKDPDHPIAGKETAVSKEQTEKSFEWILPESPDTGQPDRMGANQEVVSPKKKNNPSAAFILSESIHKLTAKSITAAVILAVLLGTGFGILMLKLVIVDNGKLKTAEKTVAPARVTSGQANHPVATVVLPSFTLAVVQKGVFSTKEAVAAVSKQMSAKGLPADFLEIAGKYYLFLGVTNAMADAKSLGNFFQASGTTGLYPKNLAIPEKRLDKVNSAEKRVLESSIKLFPIVIKSTSYGLTKVAIPSEMMKTMTTIDADLKKIDEKQIKNEKIKELKSEISAAFGLAVVFQQGNDKQALLKAQQHLLTFLSLYNSL